MASNNNSFQNYNGWSRYKIPTTRAWATTGTTDTVTDANCKSNSLIVINNQVPPVGRWAVVTSSGSFVVTSSDSETQTTTIYEYVII